MSRALSANVSAGIAGGSNSCYLLRVYSSANTYYWATQDFIDGGTTYYGNRLLKNGLGKIINEIDISRGGGAEKITDWQFRVANADMYYDTLYSEHFENRNVELRLIFPDQASASWANALPLFFGYISDIPEICIGYILFKCKHGIYNRHRSIPTLQLTKDRYKDMPDENEGEFAGIIYGDFQGSGINRKGIAYSGLASSPYQHRDYVRGLMTKRVTGLVMAGWNAQGTVALAEHELVSDRASADAEQIFLWDNSISGFIGMDIDYASIIHTGYDNPCGAHTDEYNHTGGFSRNRIFNVVGRKWYCFIPRFDEVLSSTSGISDPQNAVDESPSNKTTLSANNTDYVAVTETIEDGSSLVWDSVKIYLTRDGDETVDYSITDGTNTSSGTISTFGSTVSIDISAWTGNPMEAAITITLNTNLVGGAFGNVYIHHLHVVCKSAEFSFQNDAGGILYQSVQGRAFKKWIDSPNHSNSFSAGDLIENPAYVIESILCDSCRLTTGGITGALDFDGSNDHLVVKDTDALSLTDDMSISLWVYLDANDDRAIIRKAEAAASTYPAPFDFFIDGSGRPVISRGDGSSCYESTATNVVGTGAWHHLAVTIDRSGGNDIVTHYLDGVANGTSTTPQTVSDAGGDVLFSIACRAANHFNGKMDEVCLWNKKLTQAEITVDYNSGNGFYHTAGTPNLVACWHFDEGTGYEYMDDSGMGHHAGLGLATYAPARAAGKVSTTQQLSEADFDTIATLKDGLECARQITDSQNTRDLITEICYEFGFAYLLRYTGLEAIKRIDQGSGALTTYDTTNFIMTGQETSFKINRGSVNDVFNEYFLYYQRNSATGNYDRVMYVKRPDAGAYDSRFTSLSSDGDIYWGKCNTAFVNFNMVRRWEYKAKWIRTAATAEAVLKLIINWLTRIPHYLNFTSGLETLALELLDEGLLTHDLLPSAMDATSRFRCTKQVIDPPADTIDYTFMEVA